MVLWHHVKHIAVGSEHLRRQLDDVIRRLQRFSEMRSWTVLELESMIGRINWLCVVYVTARTYLALLH